MSTEFKRVLIVDDCRFVRARLSRELSGFGYLVSTAEDGVEALSLIESERFDFVLTDWEMPKLDGERLCKCIRSANLRHYVYVIMMTAHTNSVDVVAGMTAGADDFVTKPIDCRELAARMMNGNRILGLTNSLADDATRDALTGVLNRRTLPTSVNSAIDLARRQGRSLSCLMVDLDHFKQINDEQGHVVGDRVLVSVADALMGCFRANDLVFRYGGEEFLVLLHGADEMAAKACAERFRMKVEELGSGFDFSVTVSCGVAEADNSDMSSVELVDRADSALVVAKQRGRNRTVCISECLPKEIHRNEELSGLPGGEVPVTC